MLTYSTYLGGSSYEYAHALAPDGSGGVWVAGQTRSTDFPTVGGGTGDPGDGADDAFVSHFTASGVLTYSTYLGGNDGDYAYTLAPDGSGGVWVAGHTASTNFPTAGGGSGDPGDVNQDAFVSHVTASGALTYSTYLGGSSYEYALALAPDGSGGVWVEGFTGSTDFPTAGGGSGDPGDVNQDAFVARIGEEASPEESVAVVLVHGGKGTSGNFSSDGRLYRTGNEPCRNYNSKKPDESKFGQPPSDQDCLPRMGRLLKDVATLLVAQPFDYREKTLDGKKWTIRRLAGELHKHIECVTNGDCISPQGTKVDKVDIIAHSMGGLIARTYIAGMAVDAEKQDAPLPYSGKVRKLVTGGTPNYGIALFDLLDIFRPKGFKPQIGEMTFGSNLLWDLNEEWQNVVLAQNRISENNTLVIGGTQDDGIFQSNDDGLVNIASAALPNEFLPESQIRYVPYRHADVSLIPPLTGRTLVGVDNDMHFTYRMVRDFLQGHPVPQLYTPPDDITRRGLLLIRLADQTTQAPVLPISSGAPLSIDGVPVSFRAYINPDAGTITVWPLEEGMHTIAVQAPTGYKQPADALAEIAGGRPTVLPSVVLVPAADLTITDFFGPSLCIQAGKTQKVAVTVKNNGRVISSSTRVAIFLSFDRDLSADDVQIGEFNLGSLKKKTGPRTILKVPFSSDLPERQQVFLTAVVDPDNVVDESDEGNNSLLFATSVCPF